MYYLNGPKVPHTMHVAQAARRRRVPMHGLGAARYDPRLFPSDPYYPPVYGNYVNKQVSIPEGWWYPHPFTHYFHFDMSGIDGLGSWWNPFSWGILKGGQVTGGVTSIVLKDGRTITGDFIESGDQWFDAKTGIFYPKSNVTSTTGAGFREGQGWLAKLFGTIGSGIKSLGGGMYSLFNKSTGQTETKTYAQLTPEQQLAAKQAEQWNASALGQIGFPQTIFGIDTNLALIIAAVGAFGIFFMMRQQGGGAQQPIVVIPGLQQQTAQKAKKNPRRRHRSRRKR